MKRQDVPRIGQKIADVVPEGKGLIAKMSLWLQQQLRLLGRNPDATVAPLSFGASPAFYLNDTDFDMDVLVTGGTVTSVDFTRDNGATYHPLLTSGMFRLNPGDAVSVAFTSPPNITLVPR
jgi:hypothetical protein